MAALSLGLAAATQAAPQQLLIAPQQTDARLAGGEAPHWVSYEPAVEAGAPLLVWLGGTGGKPATGPRLLYETALQQGFRLIALSYLNTPAVSQVCVGPRLRAQAGCAARFRQQRVWGEPQGGLIDDRPEDAIVPRLVKLLQHLARSDAAGHWAQYLDGEQPRWSRIWLAGQSQGGGMAGFIAQTEAVGGVLMFSGGWDRDADGDIAAWYARPSVTPPARWHASYHVAEPQAATMARIYRRLGVPEAQIHALDLPVRGASAHGEGIANPAYRDRWLQMLQRQP